MGDRRIDFEEPQQVEVRGDREWRLLIVSLHFRIPSFKPFLELFHIP